MPKDNARNYWKESQSNYNMYVAEGNFKETTFFVTRKWRTLITQLYPSWDDATKAAENFIFLEHPENLIDYQIKTVVVEVS